MNPNLRNLSDDELDAVLRLHGIDPTTTVGVMDQLLMGQQQDNANAQKIIRLAQLLYELATDSKSPRWEELRAAGDLPDANTAVKDLWLTKSRAILEELQIIPPQKK